MTAAPTHQPADPVPPIVCWHCGCQQTPDVTLTQTGGGPLLCESCMADAEDIDKRVVQILGWKWLDEDHWHGWKAPDGGRGPKWGPPSYSTDMADIGEVLDAIRSRVGRGRVEITIGDVVTMAAPAHPGSVTAKTLPMAACQLLCQLAQAGMAI